MQYYIFDAHDVGLFLVKPLIAADRGVRVRILINSMASTDVPAVHSAYSR